MRLIDADALVNHLEEVIKSKMGKVLIWYQ